MAQEKLIEVMQGPKFDGSMRPMYFKIVDGKKIRISESKFNSGLGRLYTLVPWTSGATK